MIDVHWIMFTEARDFEINKVEILPLHIVMDKVSTNTRHIHIVDRQRRIV